MLKVSLRTSISLLIIATALSSMVKVMKKIGRFAEESSEEFAQGFFGLLAMLGAVVAFVKLMPEKEILKTSLAMLVLGIAINKFTSFIDMMAKMTWQQALQGVLGLAGVIIALGGAMRLMPDGKKSLAGAIGMRVIAAALQIVSTVIEDIGKLDSKQFGVGIAGFIVALGGLVAAMALINQIGLSVKGALGVAAILGIAFAIKIVSEALMTLNDVEWGTLGKLGAVVGVLLVLGAVAGFVTPIGVGMLMIAGSITLLGLGCKMAGEGMLDFAVAMEKLAVSGKKGGKALTDIFQGVINIIPEFYKSVGSGIVEFSKAITNGSEAIREAVAEVGGGVAMAAVEVGFKMMSSFVQGIRDGAADLGRDMKDAIIAILQSLSENLPPLIDEGTKLIIKIMNGLADALEENNEELRAASIRIGKQIGEGMVIGIETGITTLKVAGRRMSYAILGGAEEGADINSPSKEGVVIGEYIVDGVVIGVENKMDNAYDTGFNLGVTAIEGLKDGANTHSPSKDSEETGNDIVDGLLNGSVNRKSDIYNTFKDLGVTSIDGLEDLGIDMSFYNIGSAMAESYTNGITSGMYAYADPLAGMREMIEKDIEDHKRQDLLDPSLWRMRKTLKSQLQNEVTSMLDDIEVKSEKTRKEMTTGIGYGINHRLAMGLKLYSEQALKAAEETKERTLRPITDMSKNFNIDTSKIESTFARLTNSTSALSAELELDNNVTVNHTFDKLVVEGVNNKGEFVAAADYSVEKVIASLMRRQGRV